MSDDSISRQDAIDALRAAYWDRNIQSAKDDPCIVDAMTDWAIRQIKALPSEQPKRKPSKTLAEEVERIKREITDIFAEQMSAQPEPIKIHLDPELTKEERERLMRIGDSPVMVIPPDRQEITVESAVGFLQSIGWMQEHDKAIYKHGKSKGIKRGMAMARRKEAGGD